ncbi:MAG: anion permease [Deltaproteobacteria bacterium]|nr:anion permease [Deltaproteobacteria bacterium]MBW2535051.1 anion permease [Deltaproteobacteria bacterium]
MGANDASNIFGTAVTSRMVRFRTAAILASIFVIIGALAEGAAGMHTLSGLGTQSLASATVISVATALAVTLLTLLKLPVSTSQAVVGAILGRGIYAADVQFAGIGKVVACWVGTPIGAMVVAALLYLLLRGWVRAFKVSFIRLDGYLRFGLIAAGCYGAYALGANNVANVTGVFMGLGMFGLESRAEALALALVGSVSIALGICTFSFRVMLTVGKSLYELDAFTAFVAVAAHALTVHFYAWVGVPVSTSQAIIGAVLGIIAVKGFHLLDYRPLLKILSGWIATPLIAGAIALAGSVLFL